MEWINSPLVVALIGAALPGTIAFFWSRQTKRKVGDVTEKMIAGFDVNMKSVKSFQEVIEAQAEEIRRLRHNYAEDRALWRQTEQMLHDDLSKEREHTERLLVENASLKVKIKTLERNGNGQ